MLSTATSRIVHEPEHTNASRLDRTWVWPLPRLDGIAPRILPPSKGAAADRIELGYPGRSSAPAFVPVFAARDGVIAFVGRAEGRPTICLDHAGGWSTQYAELAHVLAMRTDRFQRRRKVRVRAGDVLGHARPDALRVRFALGQLVDGEWSLVDPADAMLTWALVPWFTDGAASASLPRAA